jgi:hypothetical protein
METLTQTKPLVDYKKSAELLKEVASLEFRSKMEETSKTIGNPILKFNNYTSNRQTESLKVYKHIGLIVEGDPMPHFTTFDSKKHRDFSSYQQSPKPLGNRFVLENDYESTAKLFNLTPEYLLRVLGR